MVPKRRCIVLHPECVEMSHGGFGEVWPRAAGQVLDDRNEERMFMESFRMNNHQLMKNAMFDLLIGAV